MTDSCFCSFLPYNNVTFEGCAFVKNKYSSLGTKNKCKQMHSPVWPFVLSKSSPSNDRKRRAKGKNSVSTNKHSIFNTSL